MDETLKVALRTTRDLLREGRTGDAERALKFLLSARPSTREAAILLARLLGERRDLAGAVATLSAAVGAHPADEALAVELAVTQARADDLRAAVQGLRRFVERAPASPLAWLLLGEMLADLGDGEAALRASYRALEQAHLAGVWLSPQATPPHMVAQVAKAVGAVRKGRRQIFAHILEEMRARHGGDALRRTETAVAAYLGDLEAEPEDAMQKPRFFYFPGLPTQPYLDPMLQPWAPRLRDAFPDIRAEALALLTEPRALEAFITPPEGQGLDRYLGGLRPSWDAFFFYRHGSRYENNHARCPKTSQALESIELARIPGQTPEICFSVLAPGTHILPHHGVTNTRLVMHLPLIVPADCALHLVDRGVHRWEEGRLVMFDDTFLHESWNRSAEVRVILLMDCWNPHLTAAEKEAVARIAQAIGTLDVALEKDRWRVD